MEVNIKSGSNLPKVIWKVEVLKAVDDAKFQSKDGNGEISKVTWRIHNFSSFTKDEELCSEDFSVDGNKWNIVIFPKGEKDMAIDPEEPTDEDMNTFFSSLESQLSSSKIVVSQEEAKEALS
ncbi:hypothetical protein V6N13_038092 [Hibiscus sabdariffa]